MGDEEQPVTVKMEVEDGNAGAGGEQGGSSSGAGGATGTGGGGEAGAGGPRRLGSVRAGGIDLTMVRGQSRSPPAIAILCLSCGEHA